MHITISIEIIVYKLNVAQDLTLYLASYECDLKNCIIRNKVKNLTIFMYSN